MIYTLGSGMPRKYLSTGCCHKPAKEHDLAGIEVHHVFGIEHQRRPALYAVAIWVHVADGINTTTRASSN